MSEKKDIRALIDEMKNADANASKGETNEAASAILDAVLAEKEASEDLVEVANPEGVREIVRQLALIKLQKAALESNEKDLSTVLKTLIDGHKGIRYGTTPLARVTVSHPARVKTKLVAELYPIEQFPQLYDVTEQSTLLIDPDFKRQVITDIDAIGDGS